jgi:hypothetical protein
MKRKKVFLGLAGTVILVGIGIGAWYIFSRPEHGGRLDDMNTSSKAILETIPDVEKVKVNPSSGKTTSRLIHIRNTHIIREPAFAQMMVGKMGRKVTPEEFEDTYRLHIESVTKAQRRVVAIGRSLAEKHGVTEIGEEGLPLRGVDNYLQEIEDAKQAPEKEKKKVMAEIGPTGQLLMLGLIKKVIPIEDPDKLAASQPTIINGIETHDPKSYDAREEAVVKLALSDRRLVVIIFGGNHNFAKAVSRVAPTCEYVRVTPKDFEGDAEED